ncbi:MAG: DEAD/DEAH box helicase family protein, partial [Chloroflexi bacterium]|nr:DEAD/DEAH box helicase family protein [Chloroflexota bacterium]
MDLFQLIDTFRSAITGKVTQTYPPLYRPSNNGHELRTLKRRPLGAQADAIRGTVLSLGRQKGTTVVGEMGTGKTFIAASAAYLAGFQTVLVLCPPHLVQKWKREVEETVPGAHAAVARSITDLERLRRVTARPLFAILSRERAKLSYRWRPAVVPRWAVSGGRLLRDDETGEPYKLPCCPSCFSQVLDPDGIPVTLEELARKKHRCTACREPLWQADPCGPRRYPLADYVKRHMPGFFELLLSDEVHEYKARGSAQGIAAGVLAEACPKSLTLTGTLMGGYASTLFYLLYRFAPAVRRDFRYSEEARWVSRYGFLERTVHKQDDDAFEDGRASRRRGYRARVQEKPGITPGVLFHLIGQTVFLRLADVASALPPYDEKVMLVRMDQEEDINGLSQARAYNLLFSTLRAALVDALAQGSKKLLATYLQTLLAYPDGCTKGETVLHPDTQEVIVQVP